MNEKILNLIDDYKDTEQCLTLGLQHLPQNNSAKAKLEVLKMVINDLEESMK